MQAFDIFLAIIALAAAIWGFSSGFVRQIGSFAGILLGVAACRMLGSRAAALLGDSPACVVLGYAATFVAAYFLAWLVALLARKALEGLKLGIVDRLVGAVFKVFLWMFVLSLLLNVWVSVLGGTPIESPWASRVERLAPAIVGFAKRQASGKGGDGENQACAANVTIDAAPGRSAVQAPSAAL